MTKSVIAWMAVFFLAWGLSGQAADPTATNRPPDYYHLRQGVVFYVPNPKGETLDITVDLKDINTYCQGPQTALLKVYDPSGAILSSEELPDDGITDGGYDQAWAGWDHEMWARGGLREAGAEPLFRWDAFSNPAKLEKLSGLTRTIAVDKPVKGVYQIQVVGCDDHFVKVKLSPGLKYGVLGHPDFIAGRGDQFRTSYLCVPRLPFYCRDEARIDLWIIENSYPRTRRVTLFNGATPLSMTRLTGATNRTSATALTPEQALGRAEISLKGIAPGTILKLVNEGSGDFLLRVHGVPGILCPDEETARLIAGGVTALENGPVVTFPFQRKLWDAVKGLRKEDFVCNVKAGEWFKPDAAELAKLALHQWELDVTPAAADRELAVARAALEKTQPFTVGGFLDNYGGSVKNLIPFYLYPFKGNALYRNAQVRNLITLGLIKEWMTYRGGEVIFQWSEMNIAYDQGFHWDVWVQVWQMKESFDPAVLSAFQEGVRQMAERMYYANGLELVLSNGRTTIPLNLYYAYMITGDESLKQLSKRYFTRMSEAQDGPHAGRSPSGYFREHFSADGGYCTYPLYQLGRLYRLSGDPDVLKAMDELCRWICAVTLPSGEAWVGPTSWQARIAMSASEHMWGSGFVYIANKSEWAARLYRHFLPAGAQNYDVADPVYEPGQPVPDKKIVLTDLTRGIPKAGPLPALAPAPAFTDLGNGHEFFTVRRGNYYAILYAGKRTPFWMNHWLGGVNNFNGGGLAGLYVAGAGAPVIVGRCNKEYGWPIEDWQGMAVPVVAGTMTDGRAFNTGVSRNTAEAKTADWTLRVTGEAISAPVNYERSYVFEEARIKASLKIRNSDLDEDVFNNRPYFRKAANEHIKTAWELVPVNLTTGAKATAMNEAGQPIGPVTEAAIDNVRSVKVEVGKGGATLAFDEPRTVRLSKADAHADSLYGVRSVQIKLADEVLPGEEAGLAYTITPF